MKKSNLKASPGVAIIKGITVKDERNLVLLNKVQGRILKGKIIWMGDYDTTSTGEKILPERFGKEGDIVYFLHYAEEGGVDIGMIDSEKYYFVKWADFRGIEK